MPANIQRGAENKNGGIPSTPIFIARYVVPQIMQIENQAKYAFTFILFLNTILC